jgi:AmmeMemoRadiSam system protein B
MNIRHPAVAGTFYEKSAQILQSQLEHWLSVDTHYNEPIRALIVPHAGYLYSGQVAADAFSYLRSQAERIHKVILVGPSHHFHFAGCAVPDVDFFHTPLGYIPVDKDWSARISYSEDVNVSNQAHAFEHCLEVQLPFLQRCLQEFTVLPVLTGYVSPMIVAKLIDPFWQDDQTLLVISSDLSHYHAYGEAQQLDQETCDLIEHYEPMLTANQACGATGINALLLLAKRRGYHLKRITRKNSGDTSIGDKERVVGYVSYLVSSS